MLIPFHTATSKQHYLLSID